MGSTASADRDRVLGALNAIDGALDVLTSTSLDGFTPAELLEVLTRLEVGSRRVPAVSHRVIHALSSQARPQELGDTTWNKLLAARLQISIEEAGRRTRDAEVLGPRTAITGEPLEPVWPNFAAAQADGLIGAEHLTITRKFFAKLPDTVDTETRCAAEQDLARNAAEFGPAEYRSAVDLMLALLHPDGDFDDAERRRRRGVTLGRPQADGSRTITGVLTPEAGAVFEPIIAKLGARGMCNPDDVAPCVTGRPSQEQIDNDTRTPAQRCHDAFLAAGRIVLSTKDLGELNGLPVTVIVSTTLAELEAGAGCVVTGGGSRMPMRDLIRLASHAYHYLAVFDDHGRALHLGRSKRIASADQRIVLHACDYGCTKPGCTAAGYYCQAHHLGEGWTGGTLTDVDDMTLACGPDNRMCTEFNWDTRLGDHGRVEWIPPPHLDHGQPKVNPLHHPYDLLAPPEPDPVQPVIPPRPTGDPHDERFYRRLQEIHDNNLPYGHDPDDPSAYYDDIFGPDAHDTTGQTFDDYLFNLDPDVLASLDPDRDHYQDGYWTNIEPDAEFLEEYRWAAT